MQMQKKMELDMLTNHREFVANLEESVVQLDKDIKEAMEMEHICTDEWCRATENVIDELHKAVYSISEPRWATAEDSKKISHLRQMVRDMYVYFKSAKRAA
jgi:IS1 family transposase